jgi:hypothetical protein
MRYSFLDLDTGLKVDVDTLSSFRKIGYTCIGSCLLSVRGNRVQMIEMRAGSSEAFAIP